MCVLHACVFNCVCAGMSVCVHVFYMRCSHDLLFTTCSCLCFFVCFVYMKTVCLLLVVLYMLLLFACVCLCVLFYCFTCALF